MISRREKSEIYGFSNNFIEKELGVSVTSRNWSTVTKLVAIIPQGRAAQIAAKV